MNEEAQLSEGYKKDKLFPFSMITDLQCAIGQVVFLEKKKIIAHIDLNTEMVTDAKYINRDTKPKHNLKLILTINELDQILEQLTETKKCLLEQIEKEKQNEQSH